MSHPDIRRTQAPSHSSPGSTILSPQRACVVRSTYPAHCYWPHLHELHCRARQSHRQRAVWQASVQASVAIVAVIRPRPHPVDHFHTQSGTADQPSPATKLPSSHVSSGQFARYRREKLSDVPGPDFHKSGSRHRVWFAHRVPTARYGIVFEHRRTHPPPDCLVTARHYLVESGNPSLELDVLHSLSSSVSTTRRIQRLAAGTSWSMMGCNESTGSRSPGIVARRLAPTSFAPLKMTRLVIRSNQGQAKATISG